MGAFRKVYLIGFMGSGKTTAGQKLATLLNWSFTDLDRRIEEALGLSVPEIFERYGEDYFRKKESEELHKLKDLTDIIVSTGGGAPCFGGNMDFMLKTGLTVYLQLTPAQLKSRLSGTNGERPLLKDLGEKDLLGFISERLGQREKWYGQAELVVDGFSIDLKTLCNTIRSTLNI